MQQTNAASADAKPTKIETLNDEEFVDLSRAFSMLPSIEQKVAFILSHSKTAEGIIKPLVRLIEGTVYSYGFDLDWYDGGESLVLALHERLNDQIYNEYRIDLDTRLAMCSNKRETVNLLNTDLAQYKSRLTEPNYWVYETREFYLGYEFGRRKSNNVYGPFNVSLLEELDSNQAFYEKVNRCVQGAVTYKMEMHVEQLLEKELSEASNATVSKAGVSNEPPSMNIRQHNQKSDWRPLDDDELMDFIKPAFRDKFLEMEQTLKTRVETWISGEDKIDCAGFLDALFTKGYFLLNKLVRGKKTVNNAIVREFARRRYGPDLTWQLGPQKKAERHQRRNYYLKLRF